MMMSFESFFVVQLVFPPLVLRVVVGPVEQAVLRMNVRIAQMFQVVAHQFACEQQFVLQQVLVWLQDQHIAFQPCSVKVEDLSRITYHKFDFPMRLPFGDVPEQPVSRSQHGSAMAPLERRFVLFSTAMTLAGPLYPISVFFFPRRKFAGPTAHRRVREE